MKGLQNCKFNNDRVSGMGVIYKKYFFPSFLYPRACFKQMKYKVIIIKEVAAKIVNFHDMIPGTGFLH